MCLSRRQKNLTISKQLKMMKLRKSNYLRYLIKMVSDKVGNPAVCRMWWVIDLIATCDIPNGDKR